MPSGWLYTIGNKILLSNGNGGGTPWMGRGANMDDVFFCGYNNTLWMSNAEKNVTDVGTGMVKNWKANFMRISLSMNSNAGQVYSWTSNPAKDPKAAKYQTPMTSAINAISANPGVHVLVTVRSDVSMVEDMNNGDPEATGVPTAATDSTYVALVDTFAQNGSILFGLSNEPGGGGMTDTKVMWDAMSHAVGAIRAEEDRLSAPHHIVSVQGTNWTSKIGFYSTKPLPYDNVVYEVHGYPPTPDQYTFSNIPVIIGEYGSLPNSSAFFADIEAKQIPNLAWDFDPFNNCAPDLLNITGNASSLVPSAWGTTVLNYLMSK